MCGLYVTTKNVPDWLAIQMLKACLVRIQAVYRMWSCFWRTKISSVGKNDLGDPNIQVALKIAQKSKSSDGSETRTKS